MHITQEQKELIDKCLTQCIQANEYYIDMIKDKPLLVDDREETIKETQALKVLKGGLWDTSS